MKQLCLSLIFFLTACACSHAPKDSTLNLGPYPQDVCALISRIQMAPMIEPIDSVYALRNRVEQYLVADTSAHTQAVRLYMDIAINSQGISDDRSRELLDSALQFVDSINYPIMMHRIKAEILKLEAPFTKNTYYDIKRELDYFGYIGDSLSMALLEVSLGPDFYRVGCVEEAMEVTKKVMKTFERIGQPRFVSRTRINEAIYYEAMGCTAKSDSVKRILLADDEIRTNSPIFREGLVRNAYIDSRDTVYLNEGLKIVQSDSTLFRRMPVYYSFIAEKLLYENKPDTAIGFLQTGWSIGEKYGFPNVNHRLRLLEDFAHAYEMQNKSDSALKCLKTIIHLKDSIRTLDSGEEIIRTTYGREMEALKYEQEIRRNHDRWVWSLSIIGMIFVGLAAFAWIWKQRQSTLLSLSREQREMERTRHELAANILAKQEKENLLSEMNRQIGRMTTDGHMSQSAASELQTMIRLHETGQKEWEALEELLVKIRPRFMAKLHAIAPDMSVKYCRLAAYIYVGMSSQQIARLLMIRPMSVYQARWRLRNQLAIPEGEGLEEFLEKLGEE